MKPTSHQDRDGSSSDPLLVNSELYRHAQAERKEVLRHKWFESERLGRDVGYDAALIDWALRHRTEWLRSRGYTGGI
ncbi:MAG: hypothetical protein AAF555_02870 [Verrucomicrobiota bacterium]